jgi:hypothetical protein
MKKTTYHAAHLSTSRALSDDILGAVDGGVQPGEPGYKEAVKDFADYFSQKPPKVDPNRKPDGNASSKNAPPTDVDRGIAEKPGGNGPG